MTNGISHIFIRKKDTSCVTRHIEFYIKLPCNLRDGLLILKIDIQFICR